MTYELKQKNKGFLKMTGPKFTLLIDLSLNFLLFQSPADILRIIVKKLNVRFIDVVSQPRFSIVDTFSSL